MDMGTIKELVHFVAGAKVQSVQLSKDDWSISIDNNLAVTTLPPMVDTSKQASTINAKSMGYVQWGEDSTTALVQVGDSVAVGEVVVYLRGSLVLHPVISDKAGTVEALLVQADTLVGYDTPLIALA